MAKRTPTKKKPPFRCHDGREIKTLEHVIVLLLELEIMIMAVDQTVTDALSAQDANIAAQDAKLADLSAKVDAFIASHQGSSAADNAAIVAALQAQGTKVQAEGAVVDGIAAKLA
jgi:hypothetical protein